MSYTLIERADFLKLYREQVLGEWDPYREYLLRYGEALYFKHELARLCNPREIVELGVRAGYSMWAMMVSCPGARYTGYDFWKAHLEVESESEEMQAKCLNHFAYLATTIDSSRVVFHKVDTQGSTFRVAHADLYHIDAAHTPAGCFTDIVNCIQSMDDDSLIVVHDYNAPNMRAPVKQAAADFGLSLVAISNEWGDAVLCKGEPPEWLIMLRHRWREWWHPHSLALATQVIEGPGFFQSCMEDLPEVIDVDEIHDGDEILIKPGDTIVSDAGTIDVDELKGDE